MKILFPIGSFYPAQEGGPDNSVYWLNQELNKKGIDTTVISTLKGIKGVDIKPGKSVNKYGVGSYFFNYYGKHFACPRLYKWFFENVRSYDVVHITSIFFPMSFIVAFIANFKGVRFVVSPRGELDAGALFYGKVKKLFYLKLVRVIFRKASFFHATCENERKQIERYLGKDVKCFVIPNAIGNFEELFEEVDIYEKFGISKNSKYILYLGRISPIKAVENLIEAFASINYDNTVLVIAGDSKNPYGWKLKQLTRKLGLSERVKFVGPVQGDIKENLYSKAEIFVLPSHTENFGNVVIEALKRGLPVIASTGTPWKILEEYNCGCWVENKPETLTKAIKQFLKKDNETKNQIKENAKALVSDKFTMEKVIEKYIEAYKKIGVST